MRQRVCLSADAQVGVGEGFLNGGDELMMWDGAPARGRTWRRNATDLIEVHMGCAAMQGEIWTAAWDNDRVLIKVGDHNDWIWSCESQGNWRSILWMTGTASCLAFRLPVVNQDRLPATSNHSTLMVPSDVMMLARRGRSCLSKEMDERRVIKRQEPDTPMSACLAPLRWSSITASDLGWTGGWHEPN